MRVGLVIYGSLDPRSGGYLYDQRLVEHLERCGDEITLISLPWRSYGRHLADNTSTDLLRRMRGGFDVLLQDELNHPSLVWANRRLGCDRPPIVAIVHHLRSSERRPAWQNRFYHVVERRYLRSVDGFVYNSRATRRVVEASVGGGIPHVVAYPGGDRLTTLASARPSRAGWSGPLRLLFVGNLIPRKGLHVLLDALTRVSGEWRLSVVGDPDVDAAYTRRVHTAAKRAALDGRITWHGRLPDEALAAEMAASDALVVPSEYEGFGIVYLEGMGFGLPTLATTAGGAAEIVTDGENGYLIPPGDAATLAERIAALIDDPVLQARLSAAASARFACHPTWAETTAAIRGFLLEIVSNPALQGKPVSACL